MKRVLITGATSGIGEATARRLAAAGCELVLTGRRTHRLEKLVKELPQIGDCRHRVISFDVRKKSECERAVQELKGWIENIEVLINNAGVAKGVEPIPAAVIEDWETMIDTNIKGLLYMTRLILPHMIKRNRGDIVNLGSVAGRWVYPGGGVYCATKFAVRALTEGLRMDLNGTGIRVLNIEPARVETEFSLVRFGDPERARKTYEGITPLSAGDIAECIEWMIGRPRHVTIQEMVVYPNEQASVTMFSTR